jgi:transposase InsO family protein
VPSTSTIRRILHTAGLTRPEPKKGPKASLHRFEAHQPNETWQSDFTHWALADGTDTEILNFLDDHSRYLLACTAPWTDAHPAAAYAATPKAAPAGAKQGDHWHRRIDRVDQFGKLTLRHAGQLRHIGIGRAHARKHVLMLIHDADVTISDATTGEIIRELTIDPTRDYQPRESRQRKTPRS